MNTWLNNILFRINPIAALVIFVIFQALGIICCLAGFAGPLIGWEVVQ